MVGVFGKDALECAPTCELLFKDPVEAVKQTVAEIKKNENVDMIACVSHGGTWEDEDKSEDEILAKKGAGSGSDHQWTFPYRAE